MHNVIKNRVALSYRLAAVQLSPCVPIEMVVQLEAMVRRDLVGRIGARLIASIAVTKVFIHVLPTYAKPAVG